MKLKHLCTLAVACMLIAGMAGCKIGNTLTPQNGNYATLQGTIFDAITGERIGGVTSGRDMDIEIYLVQGDTIRKPSSYVGDTTQSTVGEYAFTNIPKGSADFGIEFQDGSIDFILDPLSDPNVYKIIVVKSGYQRFEGLVNMYDVDNRIGNIYLFPTDYVASDYTFTIVTGLDSTAVNTVNTPAVNTSVSFQPQGLGTFYAQTGDMTTIIPYNTNFDAIELVTDENGVATFTGAQLIPGVTYDLTIQETTVNGFTYPQTAGGTYTIGIGAAAKTVVLGATNTPAEMLQGTLYDAITNERLGGILSGDTQDTQVYLMTGSFILKPYFFIGDTTDPLCGEYGISVPDIDTSDNCKFVILKDGYQRFEAGNLNMSEDRRCDIYLFPVGFHAPDYTYQVVNATTRKPVADATIALQPVAPGNVIGVADASDDRLPASPGYLPSMTATTDANGFATFAGSTLPLGAAYRVAVAPLTSDGIQLGSFQGNPFIIGNADVTDIIPLPDLEPGNNDYGLYVTSISNSVADQYDSTGKLVITFNRAVTFTAGSDWPKGFNATHTSWNGVLNGTDPVTSTLSADGLTLTLTPNWAASPSSSELGTAITYENGNAFISVVGYPNSEIQLGDLSMADGTAINRTVNLSKPMAHGLFVTDITTVENTATLVITFSIPVTLATGNDDPVSFNATENSTAGVLDADDPVIDNLSGDGLTLTLTPNWETRPLASETGIAITYGNGNAYITVPGYPDSQIPVFSLLDGFGQTISGVVDIPEPPADTLTVTAISNEDPAAVDPAGTLDITFNQNVVLLTPADTAPNGCSATETSPAGVLDTDDPVIEASLGNQLTLQPNWTTPYDVGETGISITYSDGNATLVLASGEYPDRAFAVFSLLDANDDPIGGEVILVAAP